MNKKLYEDLEKQLEQADWGMLKEHHKREALYVVDDDSLDLVKVAVAIAEDDVTFVKDVLGNKKLRKPTDDETEQWDKEPNVKMANFLIVQPYVLIKKLH
ncbi:MAG: DUF2288 domain-containing protein [Oligoflexia bacterium]|nr:DUF2288 domain-containing protein [Oligoflexia bacterium]